MKKIDLTKGLDIPISGQPKQELVSPTQVNRVALLGDDYVGMKPTMEVAEGDHVKTGQVVFRDKKNEGVLFTSPATGTITSINRGAKRKFESLVITCEDDDFCSFLNPGENPSSFSPDAIRKTLVESGLWTSFRTRPYGKIPTVTTSPSSLFITAMDTRPLAADPASVLRENAEDFGLGITVLELFADFPIYLCTADSASLAPISPQKATIVEFSGPHPAGLPSTHIHYVDPADENTIVWHIDYQDVIGIGTLFRTGRLPTYKIISIAGPAVRKPALMKVRYGSDIFQLCRDLLLSSPNRILSGSVLDGRQVKDFHHFLGRYHNQISALHEQSGRGLFSWAYPGIERHSVKNIFISALNRTRKFPMRTALWGGDRAIYPIDSYDRVMPLDIVPLALLKSLSVGDTERSKDLGALELIEEDVALLSYVCPGKNDFGPILREVLTEIELEG